jgi:hypothetical protein
VVQDMGSPTQRLLPANEVIRQKNDTRSEARNFCLVSGAMGIRTPDLLNAIEALYQLSYDPVCEGRIRCVMERRLATGFFRTCRVSGGTGRDG